jgi:NAD(P)-dependent dehydrogenase (short-subunit alcohol dehydrogenase family)
MKTWFITGSSTGFGRQLAELALERGDRVAATARRVQALDELRAKGGERLWTSALDVTAPEQVDRVIGSAFEHFGSIDVLVSNAGYGLIGAAEEASRDQYMRVLTTNLVGSIDVIRAALPRLRAQGHGRIVQVSAAGGQTSYPGFSYYCAAKWGIEGFCETVAKEVAAFGIGVTIVEPGATGTGFAGSVEMAPASPAYQSGPVGSLRQAIDDGSFKPPNDAGAIARAIVASVDADTAPRRLTLGVDAFHDVRDDLAARLADLDATREQALSVAGA